MGFFGDLYGSRLGGLLHPRSQVHGVAHCGVLHAQIGPHLPHHHQPGVDAYPHVEVQVPALTDLLAVWLDPFHDSKPGQDRAFGVVLVGNGSAEEGQDRVAHQTRERPLVTVNRRDQVFEGTIHDLGPVFGVYLFRGRGRPLDVAEQDCYHPALAGHSLACAGRLQFVQQLLGNILQQFVLGSICALICPHKRLATVAAEIGSDRVFSRAVGADLGEAVPAVAAEAGLVWIVSLAIRAVHLGSKAWRGRESRTR